MDSTQPSRLSGISYLPHKGDKPSCEMVMDIRVGWLGFIRSWDDKRSSTSSVKSNPNSQPHGLLVHSTPNNSKKKGTETRDQTNSVKPHNRECKTDENYGQTSWGNRLLSISIFWPKEETVSEKISTYNKPCTTLMHPSRTGMGGCGPSPGWQWKQKRSCSGQQQNPRHGNGVKQSNEEKTPSS